jgi:hypothetical protein
MTDTDLATKHAPKLDFVPVIFANGEDDDIPGIVAAIENKRVQFDDKLYEPGEPLSVVRRKLVISRKLCAVSDGTEPPERCRSAEWVVAIEPRDHRQIVFHFCEAAYRPNLSPDLPSCIWR